MFISRIILNNNKSGSALLIAILILTAILTISLGVAGLISSGLILGRTQTYSTKAYFAAETGAEELLYHVRVLNFEPLEPSANCDIVTSAYVNFNTSPATCQSAPISYNLTNGAAYYVIYASSLPDTIFQATGSYRGVKRGVEVKY
jgi:hypothetical protein